MPKVESWLRLFGRWQRYQTLPADGGLDDQEERVLHAFDVIGGSLRMKRVHDG